MIARPSGRRIGYEEVKQLAEQPMQNMLAPMVQAEMPLLMRVDMLLLVSAGSAFITSDQPCIWFDPEGYKRPPMYQAPALIYPSIEITLPISPRQMILLNRRGLLGYFDAPEHMVDEYNRRTRFHCTEHFVSDSNATKPIWFERGVEPEDSWHRQHQIKCPKCQNEAHRTLLDASSGEPIQLMRCGACGHNFTVPFPLKRN